MHDSESKIILIYTTVSFGAIPQAMPHLKQAPPTLSQLSSNWLPLRKFEQQVVEVSVPAVTMLPVSYTSKSREELNKSKCLKESEITCIYSDLII